MLEIEVSGCEDEILSLMALEATLETVLPLSSLLRLGSELWMSVASTSVPSLSMRFFFIIISLTSSKIRESSFFFISLFRNLQMVVSSGIVSSSLYEDNVLNIKYDEDYFMVAEPKIDTGIIKLEGK